MAAPGASALAMVADAGMGKVLNDPIKHLNGLAARLLDGRGRKSLSRMTRKISLAGCLGHQLSFPASGTKRMCKPR
jgi:hypothetical protein